MKERRSVVERHACQSPSGSFSDSGLSVEFATAFTALILRFGPACTSPTLRSVESIRIDEPIEKISLRPFDTDFDLCERVRPRNLRSKRESPTHHNVVQLANAASLHALLPSSDHRRT